MIYQRVKILHLHACVAVYNNQHICLFVTFASWCRYLQAEESLKCTDLLYLQNLNVNNYLALYGLLLMGPDQRTDENNWDFWLLFRLQLDAFTEYILSWAYFSTLLTQVMSSRPPVVKIIPPNEQTATSPQRFSIGAIVLHSL